jgi:fluoride ion exporter CrcB/FEX
MRGLLKVGVAGAAAAALLAGCATVPTGPAVNALPGSRKTAEQYYADDAACRARAQSFFGPNAAQPANDAAAANVVGGTLLGAAVGALIGAAVGDAGAGAAIGAGTGMLGGSAAAANVSGFSNQQMQVIYDREYLQCMYARGHQVPGRAVVVRPAPPAYGYVPPRAAPAIGYPPPDTPPPPGLGSRQGYAPPSTVAPAGGYPPAGTAPPAGTGVAPSGYPPPSTVAPGVGYPPANTPPPPRG